MFEWVSATNNVPIMTLYSNNFTLNSAACSFFENTRWCCIGINKEDKKIALRPVTKREIDLKLIPQSQLHKFSLGKGYGRITNKELATEVNNLIQNTEDGVKFHADYNKKEKMLIIELCNPVRRGQS
ncbi:MAG: hypothetical protein ACK5LZ_05965 [Anaerorhabdus sp.]